MNIVSRRFLVALTVVAAALGAATSPRAQEGVVGSGRRLLDETLDLYVREGYVYYRALKSERWRLDRYIGNLPTVSADSLPREEQIAFWLNTYNALVLGTVIDHYPVQQRFDDYPPRSIRQIPGAFEQLTYQVAGRTLTLDQIEQTILSGFRDPRVYLALGRGAVGGGRLRSEAFSGVALERQLSEIANECAARSQCVHIDRAANRVLISPIFSWRLEEFAEAYAGKAVDIFRARSPIERAVLALIQPRLLTIKHTFPEENQFTFEYAPFDWTLNDLAGREGR